MGVKVNDIGLWQQSGKTDIFLVIGAHYKFFFLKILKFLKLTKTIQQEITKVQQATQITIQTFQSLVFPREHIKHDQFFTKHWTLDN